MKRAVVIFAPLMLIALGCGSKDSCKCSRDSVCVTIKNKSGQQILSARVVSKGMLQAKSDVLENGDKICMSFKSPGENSLNLAAIVSNGDTLISNEVYSEGGYAFLGTVTSEGIKVENNRSY
jgi:hypothetical protein